MAPHSETHQRRTLKQKVAEEPFVPIGILGTLAMVGHGFYTYRKSNVSLSVHIMKYRVIAQSMVVGAITIGVSYHLLKDWVSKK